MLIISMISYDKFIIFYSINNFLNIIINIQ